jgi:hypothetical protein
MLTEMAQELYRTSTFNFELRHMLMSKFFAEKNKWSFGLTPRQSVASLNVQIVE